MFYRAALSFGMVSAALHVGRIEMLLGRHREARTLLTRATERSRFPHTRYLARLFLGSMDELDGRPDAAERQYRAALQELPRAQSGRLALAALLARGGRTAEAGRVIADAAPADSRRSPVDPWWLYLPSNSDDFAVLLATLYAEVRR
jgi:predicted Zn-dependent protease